MFSHAPSAPASPARRHWVLATYPLVDGFGMPPSMATVPVLDRPLTGRVNEPAPKPTSNAATPEAFPDPLTAVADTVCKPEVFAIENDLDTDPPEPAGSTRETPSTTTVIDAGPEYPVPDTLAVHDTGVDGSPVCHELCEYPAHTIVGIGGADVATRIVVHDDADACHKP